MIDVLMAAKTSTQYMPQAIGSLLGQSITDWHLIVGVNGIKDEPGVSSDAWARGEIQISNAVQADAWNLTRAFASRTTILNMPLCPNKGQALNEMMRHARGELVAMLDVDDLWHPLKLQKQLLIIESGIEICGTQADYFDHHHGPLGTPPGRVTFTQLQRQNHVVNSSVLMRRELATWEPMDAPLEDYEMWLRLARHGRSIWNLPETLTFIRQHDRKWSGQRDWTRDLQSLQARYA